MNELQACTNGKFGAVRSTMIDEVLWFVGRGVAKALGYAKPRNATSVHVENEDKNTTLIQGSIQGTPNMTIIKEAVDA